MAIAALFLAGAIPTRALGNYDLIWLSPLAGDVQTEAKALIEGPFSTRVVGVSYNGAGRGRPVMWLVDGTTAAPAVALPLLSGDNLGSANAIDNTGRAAGASPRGRNVRGVWWESGAAKDMAVLANRTLGHVLYPRAMTQDGSVVVGEFQTSAKPASKSFMYFNTKPPQIHEVNFPSFSSFGVSSALHGVTWNRLGVAGAPAGSYAVGWYRTESMSAEHAVLVTLGVVSSGSSLPVALPQQVFVHLGTLGGNHSRANGVAVVGSAPTRRPLVVGRAALAGSGAPAHAFLWTQGGVGGIASNPQMEDLGALVQQGPSEAFGVNASGVVVGSSGDRAFMGALSERAFVWTRETGMVDLNGLVSPVTEPYLFRAVAINTRGEIAGNGLYRRGAPSGRQARGFLLRLQTALVSGTKTGPATVNAGGVISYTFLLNNVSAQPQDVTISDPLPAGTAYEQALNPAPHAWDIAGAPAVASRTVTVAAQSQMTVSLNLRVTASASSQIQNSAYRVEGYGVTARAPQPWMTAVTNQPPSVNQRPVVTLISPTECQAVDAGGTIAIEASASDSDGTITRVDFYADGSLYSTRTAAPYTATWPNVPRGRHCFSAVATDNSGASTPSGTVCVFAEVRQYTVTELPTLGGSASSAHAINDTGVVVGWAESSTGTFPVRWVGGVASQLGTRPGAALSINASGMITGHLGVIPPFTAFRWANGQMSELTALPGGSSRGVDINATGRVAVRHSASCLVWDGTQVTDIGAIQPNGRTICRSINDAGQVVGESGVAPPSAGSRLFLYTPLATPAMTDLGSLGQSDGSVAFAINNAGQVTGESYTATGGPFAFRWSSNQMENIHALGGGSSGSSINDEGTIVGHYALSAAESRQSRPFVQACGRMRDLTERIPADSGWVLEQVTGINNVGQIVGSGTFNGATRGFVLTPTP